MTTRFKEIVVGNQPVRADFKGNWDASTNTPTLASSTGTVGTMYRVSVAGSTTLDGISSWLVDDYAYFDGTVWRKDDHNNVSGGGYTPGNITEITVTSYAILVTDDTVLVNQAAAATVALTLPAGATHDTKRVQIKDKKGTASTFNITVTPNGAETIDGAGSLVINQDYAAVGLVFNGTEWSIF